MGFSQLDLPLTRLTRKEVPFSRDSDYEQSLRRMKKKLTIAPVLVIPNPSKPYDVFCDAQNEALGGALMENGQVVAHVSRKLKPREENYSTRDLELVAIVFALKVWRHYMYEVHFEMFNDHNSLEYLFDQKELSTCQ